ncbi:MAG: threonine synthase [Clostridiaceae bacterium]
MKLTSTRDKNINIDFKAAVLKGLSDDGGLFVPSSFPRLELKSIQEHADKLNKKIYELSFPEIVMMIWELYGDFDSDILWQDIQNSYDGFPIPLVKAGDLNILELFNGGSAAFKDVALSLFPKIVKQSMYNSSKAVDNVFFITATSGDTGKAAMEGIKNQPGMKLAVIYPANGVSELQERQMLSELADNILPVPINGNFDDAQRLVKGILTSGEIENSSSCNSINIARLVTQISYYYYGYIQYFKEETLKASPLNFVVPSGNFGNILAGYYAKKMGLPIGKLLAATNSNDVLYDFINTGIYNQKRSLVKTTSPSMDIIISSNVERFLFHELGPDKTKEAMAKLKDDGEYQIPKENLGDFSSFTSNDDEASQAIKDVFDKSGYIIDPHTACGVVAYRKSGLDKDTIILSTASPFKFPMTIMKALSKDEEHIPATEQEAFNMLSDMTPVHPALKGIYSKELRDKKVYQPNEVLDLLKKFKEEI